MGIWGEIISLAAVTQGWRFDSTFPTVALLLNRRVVINPPLAQPQMQSFHLAKYFVLQGVGKLLFSHRLIDSCADLTTNRSRRLDYLASSMYTWYTMCKPFHENKPCPSSSLTIFDLTTNRSRLLITLLQACRYGTLCQLLHRNEMSQPVLNI